MLQWWRWKCQWGYNGRIRGNRKVMQSRNDGTSSIVSFVHPGFAALICTLRPFLLTCPFSNSSLFRRFWSCLSCFTNGNVSFQKQHKAFTFLNFCLLRTTWSCLFVTSPTLFPLIFNFYLPSTLTTLNHKPPTPSMCKHRSWVEVGQIERLCCIRFKVCWTTCQKIVKEMLNWSNPSYALQRL